MSDTPTVASVRRRRLGGGFGVVGLWLVTRAWSIFALHGVEHIVVGDVAYYWRSITALGQVGLPLTLREYPTPVVWLLTVPALVSGGSREGYLVAFAAAMLLLDGAMTHALWRGAGRHHDVAVDFWIAYPVLVGPLSYARFDMIPAVLVGWALLAARSRPWLTGALTGLGAAIKLWPALLVGAFAARRRGRGAMLGAFGVVGIGLAALSLAIGGRARLFSPLNWQSDRGLQIESIWATPLMVARVTDPTRWRIRYSTFKAYQLMGPGVSEWVRISTIATAVGLVLTLALFIRGVRCRYLSSMALGLLVLATVAITILTNKTLSPQYLLWLGGPAAVLLLHRADQGPRWRRRVGGLAIVLLVVAALTQLTYPVLYQGLLGRRGPTAQLLATIVFVLRNLGLVVIALLSLVWAWLALSRRPPARKPIEADQGGSTDRA